jgi:hypothetical protein
MPDDVAMRRDVAFHVLALKAAGAGRAGAENVVPFPSGAGLAPSLARVDSWPSPVALPLNPSCAPQSQVRR